MYSHAESALAVSRATGWDLDDYAAGREWSGVGIGPCGRSRDSDPLEESNYRTALRLLDDAGARYAETHFSHWAVGWIDEIAHDTGHPATVAAVAAIAARLADYPVLDESDYAESEWSANHPAGYCYAVDSDCHAVDSLSRIIPRRDSRGRFC
jgi:hypothetical protein